MLQDDTGYLRCENNRWQPLLRYMIRRSNANVKMCIFQMQLHLDGMQLDDAAHSGILSLERISVFTAASPAEGIPNTPFMQISPLFQTSFQNVLSFLPVPTSSWIAQSSSPQPALQCKINQRFWNSSQLVHTHFHNVQLIKGACKVFPPCCCKQTLCKADDASQDLPTLRNWKWKPALKFYFDHVSQHRTLERVQF